MEKSDSGWIGIRSTEDASELRLHPEKFPWLGIWSKPGAPFVCIEPWYGHADPVGFEGDFLAKPEIIRLPEGKHFESTFRIEIIA